MLEFIRIYASLVSSLTARRRKMKAMLCVVWILFLFFCGTTVYAGQGYVRLSDAGTGLVFVIDEDVTGSPAVTTIRTPKGAIGTVHIMIEMFDENQKNVGRELIDVSAGGSGTEWFRWHPVYGMKFYRYVFGQR
jgi:hypothetical protein